MTVMTTKNDDLEVVEGSLSEDAKLVLAIFIPTLSRSGGKQLLRDVKASVPQLIKGSKYDKAKFALLLVDYLVPRIAKIPVQDRKRVIKSPQLKPTRNSKSKTTTPVAGAKT